VLNAIEAGERAMESWQSLDPEKRYRLLMRLADVVEQETKNFARAETLDTGKPLSMSLSVDIPQAYSCLRFYATSLPHYSTPAYYRSGASIHFTIRRPLGLVACAPHWSFPLLNLCQLVAPALVAGNCVLAISPQLAPRTAFLFAKACTTAGIPPGVINIVHGDERKLMPAVTGHHSVQAIAYWGDGISDLDFQSGLSPAFKRLALQLGSKNPAIVFADCNFHKMIVEILRSSFSNNGQHPFSTSRIYVERTIYEKFKEELVKRAQFLKVGDTLSSVTDLGAIISQEKLEQLINYIAMAEVDGGKVLCGGKPLQLSGDFEKGFFFRPAVIEGLSPTAHLNQEDFMGPIVSIAPFDTDEEAVQLANSTNFGKSACIWTQNTGRAVKMAESLKSGVTWINSWLLQDDRTSIRPIGASGDTIIGGMEALDFFSYRKLIGQPL
jgi:aminomuconate-semialdehyde/2-hydroxymuconate-6-semialdehyde dehydrogenase